MQWRSRHAGLQPAAAGLKGSGAHRVFAAAEFNAIARQRDDRTASGIDARRGETASAARRSGTRSRARPRRGDALPSLVLARPRPNYN